MEHAAISMFPLFALCERDDIGGISCPDHEQVCRAAVFIYDGHAGGVGLAHTVFDVLEELLLTTLNLVKGCECETGCPSCIHSPNADPATSRSIRKLVLEFLNVFSTPNCWSFPKKLFPETLKQKLRASLKSLKTRRLLTGLMNLPPG